MGSQWLATLLDEAKVDVLAHMAFLAARKPYQPAGTLEPRDQTPLQGGRHLPHSPACTTCWSSCGRACLWTTTTAPSTTRAWSTPCARSTTGSTPPWPMPMAGRWTLATPTSWPAWWP
ncbi:hypothetical protein MTBUT4_540017 [Magnetospirillum sp. UT-4]|nr:hypothetical protein MTBUT4_540017 [Magnetospirillum sp. UT-4]